MESYKLESKTITDPKDLDYIFSLTEEDCCKLSVCLEMFGEFENRRRFNPFDLITVPPGVYGPDENHKNKNRFVTTVGIFFFNRAFLEKDLHGLIGYINEPVTKKIFKKINKKLGYAVIEDDIPLDYMKKFILKSQKFQPYCNILSWSFTPKMLNLSKDTEELRQKLIKDYKEGLENADPAIGQKVEKELIKKTEEIMKDDPSWNIISSGSKVSLGNNLKNMFLMRGACKTTDPNRNNGYMMLTGNYMDGIRKEEYADFADSLVGGPYARAKKTEVGGALEKAFVRAFQHIVIGDKDSDCGTKRYKEVLLTNDNISEWMYNYIIEGNKLVELTSKNMNNYIGKRVKFRFSIYCEDKKHICHKCAGNLLMRIGIKNCGIACFAMMSKVKNISMKSFHDSTVKVTTLAKYGYSKIFGENINSIYQKTFGN